MDWRWAAAGGAGHIVSPRAQLVLLEALAWRKVDPNVI